VVVLMLLTIFHRLNDGLGVTVNCEVTFELDVVVVLVATTVAVNSLSLSLFFIWIFSGVEGMVVVLSLLGWVGVLGFLPLFVIGGAMMWLLPGSLIHIGAIVGLKKLVIGEFLSVFVPI